MSEASNVPSPAAPVNMLVPSAVESPPVPKVEAAASKPDSLGFEDMKNNVDAVGIRIVLPLGVV